jgi:transposase
MSSIMWSDFQYCGPFHKTDEFLRGKGHDVLRLPPYHCEFNPIEVVWAGVSRVMLDGKITLLKLMM